MVTRGFFFFDPGLAAKIAEADLFLPPPCCAFVELFNTAAGIFRPSSFTSSEDFLLRRRRYGPSSEGVSPSDDDDDDADRRRALATFSLGATTTRDDSSF